MIMVDVYVPAIAKSYDFCLEESASVASLLEEVCGMISQREHWPEVPESEKMLLCCIQTGGVLPLDKSLGGCGVRNGYRLLLA